MPRGQKRRPPVTRRRRPNQDHPIAAALKVPAPRVPALERLRDAAITELHRALRESPTRYATADALGTTYRTLCRWQETWPELFADS